jgi:muramoyltetrapeptide carboxypeptidase
MSHNPLVTTPAALQKPRPLQKGDQVRLVSPASPLAEEKIRTGIEILEAEGYRVTLAPRVFASHGYLAGSDADRAADLQEAFDDPDVALVYCSRGGYGCARLLPHLDLDRMAAAGKLFAGFSDVTTLHLALNRRGLPTLHAPMPITLGTPREAWVYESFRRALRGDQSFPEEAPRGETLTSGVAEGVVTGGCLCLLCDSIGTPEALETEGKILLIEDVDENPHRVDAMLTHLLNAGLAQRAAGILVGEMTSTDEKVDAGIGGIPWREIVQDRLGGLGVPAIVGYPFGHMPNMLTLGMGVRARLDAGEGTLTYLESVCEG